MEDQVVYRKYATGTKSRSNKLGIGTWNVQGLNKPGKLHVLEEELKRIAIMGISETHWKTSGHFISNNNNLIICSTVLGYEIVSDRIVTVKICAQQVNLNIIQVYAPTSTSTQEESENFYRKLAETIEKCQNREILVVLSDFNAKLTHISNITLVACTWRSPNRRTKNQINYLLIKRRWGTTIKDVKTYTGLECGSDHNALVAELSLKLRKPPKKIRATNRWDLRTNKKYRDRVSEIVTEIPEECI
ncbi:craniofacial development protein 2-like [Temnothorax nylanderi]|uniref:craniofacial development protein 2-like n=1 Tax=Temnothorax nylanderi TaxID=102681 RepID=UPI003A893383